MHLKLYLTFVDQSEDAVEEALNNDDCVTDSGPGIEPWNPNAPVTGPGLDPFPPSDGAPNPLGLVKMSTLTQHALTTYQSSKSDYKLYSNISI